MRTRQRSTFLTVMSEGALLPIDVLQRVAQFDSNLGGMSAEDYHCDGEKLNEVINDAWQRILRAWKTFQTARARLPASDTGTTLTRERWLLALFTELGYGRLFGTKPLEIEGKSYAISQSRSGHVKLMRKAFGSFDVWKTEDFRLVEDLSEIAYWSRPDEFFEKIA